MNRRQSWREAADLGAAFIAEASRLTQLTADQLALTPYVTEKITTSTATTGDRRFEASDSPKSLDRLNSTLPVSISPQFIVHTAHLGAISYRP